MHRTKSKNPANSPQNNPEVQLVLFLFLVKELYMIYSTLDTDIIFLYK